MNCPTCGSRVETSSSNEGTCCFIPLGEERIILEEVARIADIVKLGSQIAMRETARLPGRKARIEALAQIDVLHALWLYLTSQGTHGLWEKVARELQQKETNQ